MSHKGKTCRNGPPFQKTEAELQDGRDSLLDLSLAGYTIFLK